MQAFETRYGYGFNLHTDGIWPDRVECLWNLLDKSPKYAASLDYIREGYDPDSQYEATEILMDINFDHPYLALALILANVIEEAEGIQLTAVLDFADSDNVILAYPVDDVYYSPLTEVREKMDPIFSKYMGILTDKKHYPYAVDWKVEANPKREFFVDTPLGKLKISAKHSDNKDIQDDFPGVVIEHIDPKTGRETLLTVVEYDHLGASHGGSVYTRVYGDALQDEPTDSIYHENLVGYDMALAKKLIDDFFWEQFRQGLTEDDLQNMERVPIAHTTMAQDERFGIQVYADLVNFKLLRYILLPSGADSEVLISADEYSSLAEMNENELECLDPSELYSFSEAEWIKFCNHPAVKQCLRAEYPVGSKIDWQPACDKKVIVTVKRIDDEGTILIDLPDGSVNSLLFGYDEFYPYTEEATE